MCVCVCDLADVCVKVTEVGPQVTQPALLLGQNSQQILVQPAARQHAAHTLLLQGAAVSSQQEKQPPVTAQYINTEIELNKKYL